MLDIGWSELLVIAVVMIVVVGPKDLPKMLRAFGKATSKLRATATEFRSHFDEAMREAELDDVKKAIDDVKKYNPRKTVTDLFDPVRTAGDELRASLNNASAKPEVTPDVSAPVAMDSPLDPADVEQEAPKPAIPAAEPVVATAPAPKTAEKPAAKQVAKPQAEKTLSSEADKPVVKKPRAAAKPKTSAATKAEKPVAAKRTAAKPKTSTAAKRVAKPTKETGTDQ